MALFLRKQDSECLLMVDWLYYVFLSPFFVFGLNDVVLSNTLDALLYFVLAFGKTVLCWLKLHIFYIN